MMSTALGRSGAGGHGLDQLYRVRLDDVPCRRVELELVVVCAVEIEAVAAGGDGVELDAADDLCPAQLAAERQATTAGEQIQDPRLSALPQPVKLLSDDSGAAWSPHGTEV